MSYYFTISEFLQKTENSLDRMPTTYPLAVYLDAGTIMTAPQSDIFVSEEYFNIWDASHANNAHSQLAHFLTKTQVYRLALEILMDQALLAGDNGDEELQNALEYAFTKLEIGVPQKIENKNAMNGDIVGGELSFPVLEHLSEEHLAESYFLFFEKLNDMNLRKEYGFHNIVKLDRGPFYKNFDGFKTGNTTYIRFDKLIETCKRLAIGSGLSVEDYMNSGKQRAEAETYETAPEQLNAYLQTDRHQYMRCKEIDGLLTIMDYIPECMNYDIFSIVEQEAMKQVYAERLLSSEDGRACIEHTSHIKDAIEHNAAGNISERLQNLIDQTIVPDAEYAGAAKDFLAHSEHRQLEAETIAGLS